VLSRWTPAVPPWPGRGALLEAIEGAGWLELGRSVAGRPIVATAWGEGPCVLVLGGVHGDEPASGWAAYRLAVLAPAVPARVVVLPVLNPDGFSIHAKDNARGVDLNRNLPTRDFGSRGTFKGYDPGPAPGSEPETRVLLKLLERERPRRVLAIHQPLACVNFDGPAAAWAEAIGRAAGLPVRAELGFPTPGSLGTFLGVERGLPVVTLELGPGDPEAEWGRAESALRAALLQAGVLGDGAERS
jgi:protein MpaA